jgi:hypothetical protein
MRRTGISCAGLALAAALLVAGRAAAQEAPRLDLPLAAPSNALELKVGTGYTQGYGPLTPTRSIRDVAGAGIGASVDADYRFGPRWSIGLQGEYQEFAPNTGCSGA